MDLADYTELVSHLPGGEQCIASLKNKETCTIIQSNELPPDRLVLVAVNDPENWIISFQASDQDALTNLLEFAKDFELPLALEIVDTVK